MSMKDTAGSTPFGRLRAHYEASRTTCPACGHDDGAGTWTVAARDQRVEFRHRCPSCDAVDRRDISL
jgi:ribosomal protein L34E